MKSLKRIVTICVGMAALGGLFYNCSDVNLAQLSYPTVAASSAKGPLSLCVPTGQELMSLYVRNLNAMVRNGILIPDSDADGIDDKREISLGSDPSQRRSRGNIIDSVCLDMTADYNCTSLPITCSPAENVLRINNCDAALLGTDKIAGPPTLNLDSDRDDIPDLLEILGGSRVALSDSQLDPDGDQVINRFEYQFGSNPRQSDKYISQDALTDINLVKAASPGGCAGELWNIDVNRLPLIPTPEYTDVGDASAPPNAIPLSHLKNENVIVVVAKLRPTSGGAALGQLVYSFAKQTYAPGSPQPINLLIPFTKAGDLIP